AKPATCACGPSVAPGAWTMSMTLTKLAPCGRASTGPVARVVVVVGDAPAGATRWLAITATDASTATTATRPARTSARRRSAPSRSRDQSESWDVPPSTAPKMTHAARAAAGAAGPRWSIINEPTIGSGGVAGAPFGVWAVASVGNPNDGETVNQPSQDVIPAAILAIPASVPNNRPTAPSLRMGSTEDADLVPMSRRWRAILRGESPLAFAERLGRRIFYLV